MSLTQTQISQLYVSIFGRASEGSEGNMDLQDRIDQFKADNKNSQVGQNLYGEAGRKKSSGI